MYNKNKYSAKGFNILLHKFGRFFMSFGRLKCAVRRYLGKFHMFMSHGRFLDLAGWYVIPAVPYTILFLIF